MATFRFRLETLLKLRRTARDDRRRRLAEALRAETVLNERIRDLDQQITVALNRRSQIHRGGSLDGGSLDIDALIDSERFERMLRAEANVYRGQRTQLGDEIDNRRAALATADADLRLLQRLREKQAQRFDRGQQRRAQNEIDELAGRHTSGRHRTVGGSP